MADLFRKNTLDRLSDPEKLDEYVRIVTVPAWLTIGIIVLLVIAFGVWAILGDVNGVSPFQALFG